MSNIGRDIRQLMLEKKYGRTKPSPDFILKMLTGHLYEHLIIYILRNAGLEFTLNGQVVLPILDTEIPGTWDIRFADGKIWDIKTASEYSFNNKFVDYKTLAKDDSFGYVDQLVGYCEAEGCEAGGWIVMNKSTCQIKVIEYPHIIASVRTEFRQKLANTITQVNSPTMPPCKGVEPETFYQKLTGNRIIGKGCRFCSHKEKCHPTVKLEESRVSKARIKPLVHYID